ncbi:hypothetical protein NG20_00150 [Bacillus subtilis]|nr:hypothetical protein AWV81_10070 [Bacillus subtilis subsp. natto]AMR48786.1 hypothetical protein KHRBS_12135 [Bacillus subtilis subsp. subtilis]AOL29032.1 hypothetical protein BGM23_12470 [Bacillus sp. FJAT-14266]AOL32962.1 hypothetical protein BGM20_03380 [Alkalicoccobacillus gibsonii]AOS70236.1 hypothetical protein A4A60_10175 [Bacillus subtilis]
MYFEHFKTRQRRIHKTAAAEYNVQCHLPKKQGGRLDQLCSSAGNDTNVSAAIIEIEEWCS